MKKAESSHEARTGVRIYPDRLSAFCVQAIQRSGMGEADAQTTAEVLVTTDTWGVHSHGTGSLRQYMRRVRAGGLNAAPEPRIIDEGPNWAVVNADNAVGTIGGCTGMQTAIDKARGAGIAYVGVHGSAHFGAAGYYAYLAAKERMIGLSMTNGDTVMTVPGALGRVLGNNPLAFAAPVGDGNPIMLDIAMSTVAGMKVRAAELNGQSIPDNWLVDLEGRPTTDPSLFMRGAALQPLGAHKGYGLALMIEIIAGVLTGSLITKQIKPWPAEEHLTKPTGNGHAFIAFDVQMIMPRPQYDERITALCQEIKDSAKIDGAQRIYLPGEMEWERRDKALSEGMVLPAHVVANLHGLGEDVGLEFGQFVEKEASQC